MTSLEISGDTIPLFSGGEIQLSATALDSAGQPVPSATVLWRSIRPEHAVVSAEGLVRGALPGHTTIRASSGTVLDSIQVFVEPAAIELTAHTSEIGVGFSTRVNLEFRRLDGRPVDVTAPVVWTSDKQQVAVVDATGNVTGRGPGFVAIRATTGSTTGLLSLTVSATPVASVRIGDVSVPTLVDESLQLSATPLDASGNQLANRRVEWWSSDSSVASVGQNGLTKLLTTGRATIFAQSEGGLDSLQLSVDPGLIEVVTPPVEMVVGGMLPVEAGGRDPGGGIRALPGPLTWSSDDPAVLQVDGDGRVTAIAPGIATITVASRSQSATVTIGADDVVWNGFATGVGHNCATTDTGAVYCWGLGNRAQLGTGYTGNTPTPVKVQTSLQLDNVAAGTGYSCAIDANGTIHCWGAAGSLGIGSVPGDSARPVVSFVPPGPVTLITGPQGTCAITVAGESYCWGTVAGEGYFGTAVVIPRETATVTATLGYSHNCEIGVDGSTRCWGNYDLLGRLDPDSSRVHGDPGFVRIDAGYWSTCGLDSAGTAYCWGSDFNGQLGTDNIPCGSLFCDLDTSPFPARVEGGLTFLAITVGREHACGVTSGGDAYCWGLNSNGQVGDGTTDIRTQPVLVSGGLQFQSIDAGEYQTCGMTANAKLYCWGQNKNGAVGDGTAEDRLVPTRVPGS